LLLRPPALNGFRIAVPALRTGYPGL